MDATQHDEAVESVQEADWPAERLFDIEHPLGGSSEEDCVTFSVPPVSEDEEAEDEEAEAEEEEEAVVLASCRAARTGTSRDPRL